LVVAVEAARCSEQVDLVLLDSLGGRGLGMLVEVEARYLAVLVLLRRSRLGIVRGARFQVLDFLGRGALLLAVDCLEAAAAQAVVYSEQGVVSLLPPLLSNSSSSSSSSRGCLACQEHLGVCSNSSPRHNSSRVSLVLLPH